MSHLRQSPQRQVVDDVLAARDAVLDRVELAPERVVAEVQRREGAEHVLDERRNARRQAKVLRRDRVDSEAGLMSATFHTRKTAPTGL